MVRILEVFCALCVLGVFCAPSPKCPPGGKYFDKHLGQNGRWRCCKEICEAMIYQSICNKKCPYYKELSKDPGSRITNKTDPTPKPTPADKKMTPSTVPSQPDLKPPARSSSDSDPAATDQPNPKAECTSDSDVILVSVLGTGAVILLLILLSVLIVVVVRRRRRQQKRRGRGQSINGQVGLHMNTLRGRPGTEDPEMRRNLLPGARLEDPAAEAGRGPAGDGESCPVSQSEGPPPPINEDSDQHSQRLGFCFVQTAKEGGSCPIQVAEGSSGAMAMDQETYSKTPLPSGSF